MYEKMYHGHDAHSTTMTDFIRVGPPSLRLQVSAYHIVLRASGGSQRIDVFVG